MQTCDVFDLLDFQFILFKLLFVVHAYHYLASFHAAGEVKRILHYLTHSDKDKCDEKDGNHTLRAPML